jgi:hypothetical protein
VIAAALLSSLALTACSTPLPVPPRGDHAGAIPVVVPYPPPPARVDVVPYPPKDFDRPAWVDGQWIWRGRRWVWEEGRWVDLDPQQVYANPMIVRRSDGQLVWFAGTLRTQSSPSTIPIPAAPIPAATSGKEEEVSR